MDFTKKINGEKYKEKPWEPFFVDTVPNITVPAGKDATLSCQVDNLHGYKVRIS